jgi:hypothetical protein
MSARGVYSCKAIRRPAFVQNIMDRSLTQSTRHDFEESFLMITKTHIIEFKVSMLNKSTGKVLFVIPIDKMAMLTVRPRELLTLFFKPKPGDPLIYMCPDSGVAAHQIQKPVETSWRKWQT